MHQRTDQSYSGQVATRNGFILRL